MCSIDIHVYTIYTIYTENLGRDRHTAIGRQPGRDGCIGRHRQIDTDTDTQTHRHRQTYRWRQAPRDENSQMPVRLLPILYLRHPDKERIKARERELARGGSTLVSVQ